MHDMLITLALILVKLGLIFAVVLSMAAYLVLAERKILGRMQLRYGPNRIGPGGMIQPLCDVIKLITKEDFVPDRADKWVFLFAPGLTALTALLSFAVVPFAPPLTIMGREVPMVVCDLNIGLHAPQPGARVVMHGDAVPLRDDEIHVSIVVDVRGDDSTDIFVLGRHVQLDHR